MESHREVKKGDKHKRRSDEGSMWLRMATSTVFLIVAFISSTLFLQIIIAVLSRLFRYWVIFRYNHVTSVPTDSRYWSLSKIMAIYLTAPMLCLITAIILFFYILHNSYFNNRFRLLIFWVIVCLTNIFLSHLLFGLFGLRAEAPNFYLTFAIVGTWMRLPYAVMAILAGVSIIASIVWGVVLGKELGAFVHSSRFSASMKNKIMLAVQLYMVPWLLSLGPLLLLSTSPGGYRIHLLRLNLAPVFLLSASANFLPTFIMLFNLALVGFGIFGRSTTYTAAANMTKRRLYGGAIEMDSIRSAGSSKSSSGSLNKFPRISLAFCLILWLFIYMFLR